jgi:thioredoxin-like negative regulator of GroEL
MKRPFLSSVVFCAAVALAPEARAEEPDPAKFLGVVQSYLTVLDRMGQVAADPRAALMLAQNSIKEVYEQKGQKADAVPELRKMIDGVDDPAVRTAVRFAIADIYKETGQKDRALEELRLIVSENKALLSRRK